MDFGLSVPLAFLAGLLSFFSPCILPLVPGYMGYLGSLSLTHVSGSAQSRPSRIILLKQSVVFVMGFVSVFLLLGLSSDLLGGFMARHLDVLQKVAGIIIMGLGIHFMGWLPVSFLQTHLRIETLPKIAGSAGAYVTGLAFGFGWTPCVGPVLATIFLLIATSPDRFSGISLLTAYGFGLGLPFIFVAFFYDIFISKFRLFSSSAQIIKGILGILLILTGLAMVTGWLNDLGFWMLRHISFFSNVG